MDSLLNRTYPAPMQPSGPFPFPPAIDGAALLERLALPLALVDEAGGRFAWVNRSFVTTFGAPPGSFPAWWARVHRDHAALAVLRENWADKLAQLPDGHHDSIESEMHGRDGRLYHFRTQVQNLGGRLLLCFVDLSDKDERQDLLREALAEMETRSSTDPLTGLPTRRRLLEAAASEMHRFQRFGHPISLIIADIDHFKLVNDAFGHLVGDEVLVEFAQRLAAECRDLDVIARYGGEEFVVLLPSTPLAGGCILADKLRQAVNADAFAAVGPVTASFGVAECLAGEDWQAWLSRADKALYEAKANGRNQVVAAPESAFNDHSLKHRGRLDRLTWEEGHCVGDPLIDAQHRQLFVLANRLLFLIREAGPPAELHATIRELAQTTSRHFRDEEAILKAVGYPRGAQHAKAHRILTAKLDALLSQSALGSLPTSKLIEFLAYDLVDHHALGADRDFIPWLRPGSPDAAPGEAPPPAADA